MYAVHGTIVTRQDGKLFEAKIKELLKSFTTHEMIQFCHIILACSSFPPTISISGDLFLIIHLSKLSSKFPAASLACKTSASRLETPTAALSSYC